MSLSLNNPQHRFRYPQRAHPNNNNNIQSLMFSLGTCYAKFDALNRIKAFAWELTRRDIRMMFKNGSARSPTTKEIEKSTERLFHAHFSLKMMENGNAVVKASIKGEGDAKKIPFLTQYYCVKNGIEKIGGNVIPRDVFVEIVQQRGRIEIVAEFVEAAQAGDGDQENLSDFDESHALAGF